MLENSCHPISIPPEIWLSPYFHTSILGHGLSPYFRGPGCHPTSVVLFLFSLCSRCSYTLSLLAALKCYMKNKCAEKKQQPLTVKNYNAIDWLQFSALITCAVFHFYIIRPKTENTCT